MSHKAVRYYHSSKKEFKSISIRMAALFAITLVAGAADVAEPSPDELLL